MQTRTAGLPLAVTVHTTDFDVMAEGLPGWDARFRQMGRGSFDGRFELVELPGFTFCRLKANREVLARGNHRPHTYGIGIPQLKQQPTCVSGHVLHNGQIICLGPGITLDQVTTNDYQSVFVEIDESTFLENMTVLTQLDIDQRLAQVVLRPLQATVQSVATDIGQIIDYAQKYREQMADNALQRQVIHSLMTKLARMVQSSEVNYSSVKAQHRKQLVQRAEEQMEAHLDGSLTVIDICRELAVSERSLHYAFREVIGMTPMVLYRNKRLNAVRQYLKQADPNETTIVRISLQFGFWHTGQFAADYARLFGELPSSTLNRSYSLGK